VAERRAFWLIRWGLYATLASIPFELPNRVSLPVEIPTAAAALFLGATVLQLRRCYGRIPSAVWAFVAFLCVFALATSVNFLNDASEVMHVFLLVVQGILVFWAAANLLEDEKTTDGALIALAAACMLRAILPMVGIGRTTTTVWTGGERLTAFGQNENNAAMFLAGGLLALLGIGYARTRLIFRHRFLVLPGCLLMAYAVVETGSRGGLLALTAGLLTLFLARAGSGWARVRSAALGVVLMVTIAAFAYETPMMRNRLSDTAKSGAMAGREDLYPIVGRMILERPVIGWGPLNNLYELSLREGSRFYSRAKRDTHNLIFETLTSTGLLGTLAFCLGMGLCFRAAWRARGDVEGILPFALMVSVLVANMSGNWIASKLLWFAFAYAIAAGRRAQRVACVTPL